jgi:hypothetical protein
MSAGGFADAFLDDLRYRPTNANIPWLMPIAKIELAAGTVFDAADSWSGTKDQIRPALIQIKS